jgi:hypothetical protein
MYPEVMNIITLEDPQYAIVNGYHVLGESMQMTVH